MLARQLREFRQRLGITQVAFAEAIGVAPNTVARWERGELNMRASTAKLIEMMMRNADLRKPEIPPAIAPDAKGDE